MGSLAKISRQRMDNMVRDYGEDGALHIICDHLADGMHPHQIASTEGINWSIMWQWLNDKTKPHRLEAFLVAAKGGAVKMAYETVEIADGSTPENIAVDKERGGARRWLSGRMYRDLFGDKQSIEVTRVDLSMKDLLESREKRLLEVVPIDGQSVRVDDGEVI